MGLPNGSRRLLGPLGVFVALACAPVAAAHVERPAYFPDPAPDTSAEPAAGGGVPVARSLASALDGKAPGSTRVVCRPESLELALASIQSARTSGYEIRPSDRRTLTDAEAEQLIGLNRRFAKRCRYDEIQPAVMASGNNDRVVVMPGVYAEPTARSRPTPDEDCDRYRTNGDRPGEEGTALSYAYQFHCPNDQNLVAVIGRAVGDGEDPMPPLENRHGIPNLGPCIRCNLQLEGSGVSADDVVVDAGDVSKGNAGPNGAGAAKDVVIRADRADGFVLRNITVRHAGEHGIYVIETDGYLLDRFKAYYSRLYGTLTFASDHGLQQNCDGVGHGDSAVYPGGAPETAAQRPRGTESRLNQEIRWCDLHHNLAGYSGTNGNAIHLHHNNIYDNALGVQTDVVTAAGHPGFPGDSAVFEHNRIYSNNFNTYAPESDVKPSFPFPTGTGLWIAGGNHHDVRSNHIYDNWRRGTMLFSVPDSLICGPLADGNEQAGCDATQVSTSHYNDTFDNRMGVRPDGTPDRNGLDFWWDEFPQSRGNCWYGNHTPENVAITSSPPDLPACTEGTDPESSVGTGNAQNEAELISCAVVFETRNFDPGGPCPWMRPPTDPDGGADAQTTPLAAPFQAPATTTNSRYALDDVPLGQTTCTDWNRAGESHRATLVEKLRAFAGGIVNTGQQDVGTGAVLPSHDAHRLYDAWCRYALAEGFLLYKLYTHAAAFRGRAASRQPATR